MAQREGENLLLRRLGAIQSGGDRAATHDGDSIAHAQNFRQLGRDHEDRNSLRREISHQCMHFRFGADVDSLCRLVENKHRRIGDQPAAQRDLLLISAGECAGWREDRRCLDPQSAHVISGHLFLASRVHGSEA